MGGNTSEVSYSPLIVKMAEKHELGKEAVLAIYHRYKLASNEKDILSPTDFNKLFPFCTDLVKKNISKICNLENDGLSFDNFIPIFKCISPEISNTIFSEFVYNLFEEENKGWSIRHFIAELRSSLLFSHPDDQKNLEFLLKGESNISYIDKNTFKAKASNLNSDVLRYSKQLIFGSFIFQ